MHFLCVSWFCQKWPPWKTSSDPGGFFHSKRIGLSGTEQIFFPSDAWIKWNTLWILTYHSCQFFHLKYYFLLNTLHDKSCIFDVSYQFVEELIISYMLFLPYGESGLLVKTLMINWVVSQSKMTVCICFGPTCKNQDMKIWPVRMTWFYLHFTHLTISKAALPKKLQPAFYTLLFTPKT